MFGFSAFTFVGFNIAALPFFISSLKRFGKIPYVPTAKGQVEAIFDVLSKEGELAGTTITPVIPRYA